MQSRDKNDLIPILQLVVELILQFPVGCARRRKYRSKPVRVELMISAVKTDRHVLSLMSTKIPGRLMNETNAQKRVSECTHELAIADKYEHSLALSEQLLPLLQDVLRQIIDQETHVCWL